jgi:hypothetical protein
MAKTLKLKITQKVIDESSKANSSKCMIARAVRLAGGRSIQVTRESVAFHMDDKRYSYPLPAKAAVELIKFDGNPKSVKPFVVTLHGASGYERPIIKTKGHSKGGSKAKKIDVTKVLRGSRKVVSTKPAKGAKRTNRRFLGLRVIEG